MGGEKATHDGILGKDEGAFVGGEHLLQHFVEAGEFARAVDIEGILLRGREFIADDEFVLRRVVADLFEAGQEGQNGAVAGDSGFCAEQLIEVTHLGGVELCLFLSEIAVDLFLDLWGHIGDDFRVGFQSAEDKRGG